MTKYTLTDLNNMLENTDEETLVEFGRQLQEELDLCNAPSLRHLELFLTHRCNLRCDYCFLEGSTRQGDMSIEIAEKSLRFLIERSKSEEKLEVVLFGGEPLLRIDLMEDVLKLADRLSEESGQAIGVSCTTNGLLLDDRAVELAKKYRFNYLISLDGSREVHDRHRKTASGEGTYDKVIEGIQLLRQHKEWAGIRMTISPDAVGSVADSVEELAKLGVNGFIIDFLSDNSWQPDQMAQIKEQYYRILELYLHMRKQGLPFSIGTGEGRGIRPSRTGIWGCRAGTNGISVLANGDIYPCSRGIRNQLLRMGNIEEGKLSWEIGKVFSDERREIRWKCLNCKHTDHCSGGCPIANYETQNTPYYPPDICCTVVRVITEIEQENPRFAPLFDEDDEECGCQGNEATEQSGFQPLNVGS